MVVGASMALAMKRRPSTAPPSARRPPAARPLRTTISLTSAPLMTEPPHASITRASASVKLAAPYRWAVVSLRGRVNGNHRPTVHRISGAEIDRASVLELFRGQLRLL